jgi:adenylosuccinate synthase
MKSYIIAGVQFGDEGKGRIVDALAEKHGIKNNIRYNGGNQAAHHVTLKGVTQCFRQYGASLLLPNTKTILSKYMLIEPVDIAIEAAGMIRRGIANNDIHNRIFIDNECVIVTPIHKSVNRIRETIQRNSSCGLGVGEAAADANRFNGYTLRAKDLGNDDVVYKKLSFLLKAKLDHVEQAIEANNANDNPFITEKYNDLTNIDIDEMVRHYHLFHDHFSIGDVSKYYAEPSVYEGSQGVLLDVNHGFYPHVTKTTTTFKNAEDLCKTQYEKIGILRPYITRHGNGILPTEDKTLEDTIPEPHNTYNEWQGKFRIGWQDLVLLRYAIEISPPDYLAVTNVDKIINLNKLKLCTSYEYNGDIDVGKYFECEQKGKKWILQKIKKESTSNNSQELNNIINSCKPIYKTFYQYEDYKKYLESTDGVNIPIRIQTYSAEATDRSKIQWD